MKALFKITKPFLILFLYLFTLVSCKDDAAKPSNDEVFRDLSDSRLTTFKKLLIDNGFIEFLNPNESFTIFAPTNEALSKVNISNFTKTELTNFLNFHIIRRNRLSSAEIKSGIVQSPNVDLFLSKSASGIFINGNSKIISPDFFTQKGVIHIIDNVIPIPKKSLMETLKENPNFSELVFWISAAGGTLETDLSYPLPTVFGTTILAPTNAAFNELYRITPKSTLMANKNAIIEILRLHRISGRIFSQDFSNFKEPVNTNNTPIILGPAPNSSVTITNTFNGQYQLIFDTSNGLKVKGLIKSSSNIIASDLLATNGVIHTLDNVLIP